MNDLISRSEAKKIANKFTFTFAEERERYMDFLDYCLKNAPTVDAEPVRGEWIKDQVETGDPFGNGFYLIDMLRCSVCGRFFDVSETRNFCPECGADMRKQVEK